MGDSDSQKAVLITTSADSKSLLEQVSEKLVAEELAACCQISGPVTSIYRWQGNVESAEEWLCSIKSMPALVEQVIATIKSLHSYDEPEIVVTPIVGGSDSYLQWISDSVRSE